MSRSKWVIGLHTPIADKIAIHTFACGDADAVLALVDRMRTKVEAAGNGSPTVIVCYEAGYEGFWLQRRLDALGLRVVVIDPASDWAGAVIVRPPQADTEDPANGGIRREPELPEHEDIAPPAPRAVNEFGLIDEDAEDEPQRRRTLQRTMSSVARQVSLDPADDMQM